MQSHEQAASLDAAVAQAVASALAAHVPDSPVEQALANDVATAARRSGLSRSTLYRLMDAGELDFIKVGARRLIPEDALQAMLDAHRRRAA